MIIFAAIVVALNNTTKVQIVSREGQTFEKGIVTEIIQDNLQPDGTRAGQQLVVVHMTSGAFEGEDIAMTSNSGYLFGAPCTVGMKVVVMQSVAGDTQISSVYSQDREWAVYIFAALYLLALCLIGGWQGVKGALGLIFTLGCIIFVYLPLVYRGWSPFWTAVIICAITAVVSLYLIGGPTRKTLISTIGTVAGDLHDIGKNLVAMMLESAGFEVIDLGVDVSREKFVKAVEKNPDISLVCCSALLTTTLQSLRDTVAGLNRASFRKNIKIMVGGAPVTQALADEIGADAYTKDAAECARRARELVGSL